MPSIDVVVGAATRQARYASGSGTSALVFRYVVTAGDNTPPGSGITIGDAVNLPAGCAIRDASGRDASLGLTSKVTTAGVRIDTKRPIGTLATLPARRNTPLTSVVLAFDDTVKGVSRSSFTLTRNGQAISLNPKKSPATLTGGGANYTLGNLAGFTGLAGTYVLSLAPAGIADAVGNAMAAAVSTTWVVDLTAPAAPVISSIVDDVGATTGTIGAGGSTDDAAPTLRGSAEANATVEVVDEFYFPSTSLGTVTADGTGQWSLTTSPLADGGHVFRARATDAAGNTGPLSPSAYTIAIDTRVSTATFASLPAQRNTPLPSVAVTFSESVAGVKLASFTLMRNGVAVPLNPVANPATLTGGGANYTLGNLAGFTGLAGTYVLSLAPAGIADAVGNAMAAAVSTTWVVDLTAPAAPVISSIVDDVGATKGTVVAGGSTDDATPTLRGTTEANATVEVFDGATSLGTEKADGTGQWSFTTQALTDGVHTFKARAIDAAGNSGPLSSSASTVTIDTRAPTATFASLPAQRNTPLQSVAVTFSESVAGVKLASFTLTRNGVAVPLNPATNPATLTGSGANYSLGNLAGFTGLAGTYVLSLAPAGITDAVGNAMAAGVSTTWVVDLTAPAAPVISWIVDDVAPISGFHGDGSTTDDATPTVEGTAEANSTVEVFDGNTSLGTIGAAADGSWSFTTRTLADGPHVFKARATDAAGNAGPLSAALTTMIDTRRPTAAITAVPNAATYKAGDTLWFSVTFDEVVEVRAWSFTPTSAITFDVVIGGVIRQARYSSGSGTNVLWFQYAVVAGDNTLPNTDIALGTSLTIPADAAIRDLAGNAAVQTFTSRKSPSGVRVDTTPPTATFAAVPAERKTGLPSIAVTFSEPVTGLTLDSFVLRRDGVEFTKLSFSDSQATLTGSGASYTLSNLADLSKQCGLYELTLLSAGIIDGAGNNPAVGATTGWSNVAGPPDRPGKPAAVARDGYVDLSWTAPVSDGTIAGYLVYYSTDSSFSSYDLYFGTSETYATIEGLRNGLTYYFRVAAWNDVVPVMGPSSGIASATPWSPTTLPPTPSFRLSLARHREVYLAWEPNGGNPITDYTVQWSLDSSFSSPISTKTTETSCRVVGLSNNYTYYFRVAARNASGMGGFSSTLSRTPQASASAPSAPSPPTADTGDGKVSLSWATPGGNPILDYTVQWSTSNTFGSLNSATTTSTACEVSGLSNNVTYYFRVASRNGSGSSAFSSTVSAKPSRAAAVPAAPSTPTAVAGNGEVALTWSPPVGSLVSGYTVQWSTSSSFATPQALFTTANSCTISNLSNNQTYFFRVAASNSSGNGAFSNAASATPVPSSAVPAAPSTPIATAGDRDVKLSWTPPSGYVVSGYTVQWSTTSSFSSPQIVSTSGTSCTISNLSNNQTYYFRVAAFNSSGTGEFSGSRSAMPQSTIANPWWAGYWVARRWQDDGYGGREEGRVEVLLEPLSNDGFSTRVSIGVTAFESTSRYPGRLFPFPTTYRGSGNWIVEVPNSSLEQGIFDVLLSGRDRQSGRVEEQDVYGVWKSLGYVASSDVLGIRIERKTAADFYGRFGQWGWSNGALAWGKNTT